MSSNANSNIVEGNLIGLRPDGTAQLSNFIGVQILGSTNNVIGGAGALNRNIISGNGTGGGIVLVNVALPGGNQIANNYIGLDDDGLADRGNAADGIDVFNAVGTIIRQNVIAGNTGAGIRLGQATMTSIVGNTIGLDAAGTVGRPNNVAGILVGSGGPVNASTNNTIGGTDPADRNVISGHANGNVAIFFQVGSNGAHPWPDFSTSYVDSVDAGISANLLGKPWVQTRSASKLYNPSSAPLAEARLTLKVASTVYLVVDDRVPASAWSGWTDTGFNANVKEAGATNRTFSVLKKTNQTAVDLPLQNFNGAFNYFVVVE
jgi:hypothetical protein